MFFYISYVKIVQNAFIYLITLYSLYYQEDMYFVLFCYIVLEIKSIWIEI